MRYPEGGNIFMPYYTIYKREMTMIAVLVHMRSMWSLKLGEWALNHGVRRYGKLAEGNVYICRDGLECTSRP